MTHDNPVGSLAAGPNNSIASLYYSEFIAAGPHSFSLGHSNGQVTTGTGTTVAGSTRPLRFKFGPTAYSVGPLVANTVASLVQSGGPITITGLGFGQQCSSCQVVASNPQSVTLQVLSWSDQSITVSLPPTYVGILQLAVYAANGSDAINVMTVPPPVLHAALGVSSTHVGSFLQGQSTGVYAVLIKNNGPAATSGAVLMTDTLPAGLTATAISGPGWVCALATLACSRSDALAPGGSYPPITVTVNVATNAASPVNNQVVAAGGGSATATAIDPTTILAAFTDVSSLDSFLPAIDLLMEYAITSGCGANPPLYCETQNVTEGQMAVFVVRSVMGGDNFTYTQTPYFGDVPATYLYFPWIQKMQDLGIALPCSPTQFCPEAPVTRGIMAVLIIRGRYGMATPSNYPATPYFADVPTTHPYFPWIQKMEQLGITSGCAPSSYCPNDPVTRGQMAVFLMPRRVQPIASGNHACGGVDVSVQRITRTNEGCDDLPGQNTNFSYGVTQVNAGAGITVSNISVTNGTTLTAQFSVQPSAPRWGRGSITVTTGSEEATLATQ